MPTTADRIAPPLVQCGIGECGAEFSHPIDLEWHRYDMHRPNGTACSEPMATRNTGYCLAPSPLFRINGRRTRGLCADHAEEYGSLARVNLIHPTRPEYCPQCVTPRRWTNGYSSLAECACCGNCRLAPGSCACCEDCHQFPCACCQACGARPGYCPVQCGYCGACGESECGHDQCEACGQWEGACECGRVHSYSYKPSPQFLSMPGENPNGLFFGWELELATNYPDEIARHLSETFGESVLYCKYDGSISGVEVVSHPMTLAYFNANVARLFRDSTVIDLLRYRRPSEEYGLHVHVSRAGFQSDAHMMRWLMLMHENEPAISLVARRASSSWAKWDDKHAIAAKVKGIQRYGERVPYRGDRYVAINANNPHTLEVRVFRSTFYAKEFRACLELCAASVAYAAVIGANDILARGALSWRAFGRWVLAHADAYPRLSAHSTIATLNNDEEN